MLRATQAAVLKVVPTQVASLTAATAPGGALEGWRLSHGLVVLSTAGAVAIDNITAKDPWPPLLLYAPSSSSKPSDWLDFDGDDGPYRLVGWGYFQPYAPGSRPPERRCMGEDEWLVHEAGWHLKDGGMQLTPGASAEPPPPQSGPGAHMWHPAVWDIHYWRGQDGVPTVAYANPRAGTGGVDLPDGAFYRIVNGRKAPLAAPEHGRRRRR